MAAIMLLIIMISLLHNDVNAMHLMPVVVKRATNTLIIEVRVAGRPLKALRRPADERLQNSLFRVSKAFMSALSNNKYAKQSPEPIFLFDRRGVPLDPSMRTLDAWLVAAQLLVGCNKLRVICEPPEIVSLMLPTVPQVGVPLTPFIQTYDCDVLQCHWSWERLPPGSTDDDWQLVGSACEYLPQETDAGSQLRVRVVPPAPRHGDPTLNFLACVAEATEPVSGTQPRQLLSRRVRVPPSCVYIVPRPAPVAYDSAAERAKP